MLAIYLKIVKVKIVQKERGTFAALEEILCGVPHVRDPYYGSSSSGRLYYG